MRFVFLNGYRHADDVMDLRGGDAEADWSIAGRACARPPKRSAVTLALCYHDTLPPGMTSIASRLGRRKALDPGPRAAPGAGLEELEQLYVRRVLDSQSGQQREKLRLWASTAERCI